MQCLHLILHPVKMTLGLEMLDGRKQDFRIKRLKLRHSRSDADCICTLRKALIDDHDFLNLRGTQSAQVIRWISTAAMQVEGDLFASFDPKRPDRHIIFGLKRTRYCLDQRLMLFR